MSSDLRSAAERLQELVRNLEGEIGALAESAQVHASESATSARRETAAEFHGVAQRLRGAEDLQDWQRTLTEAAEPYCRKAVWVDASIASPGAAIRNSLEQRETTVCAVTAEELGHSAGALTGHARAWLIPVGQQGVLCVAVGEDEPDLAALELLGVLAESTVPVQPRVQETDAESQPALVMIQGISAPRPKRAESWEDLPRDQQMTHLRAQQFARVFVAELVLQGPIGRPVYGRLKKEIDAGRERFRREFFETCPGMVDYLHLELVRTLGHGDVAAMGADYPGPLR